MCMGATPTQKSLEYCRKQGWETDKAEYWNAFARVRKDLFNFVDLVALNGAITAIQTTSTSNMSARKNKILGLPAAKKWLECGGKIEIHGWSKNKSKRWEIKITSIHVTDFKPIDEGPSPTTSETP